ncbi:MAG: metal-independent alpha-mannosidase, partial [Bacteroidaceae bacterium]|nr:metal-independent alpha-mannosidase [Bacteroidaceae bacterium]
MKKIILTLLLAAPVASIAAPEMPKKKTADVAVQSTIKDLRPAEKDRLFRSDAVERQIAKLKAKLTAIDPKLFWMFQNCFPNTLDTT